jgi:hypothetical protein
MDMLKFERVMIESIDFLKIENLSIEYFTLMHRFKRESVVYFIRLEVLKSACGTNNFNFKIK